MTDKTRRDNVGKLIMRAAPWDAIIAMVEVFHDATTREDNPYPLNNWALGGRDWTEFLDNPMRHVFLFQAGQDLDSKSGKPHLAHAMAGLAILLHYQLNGKGVDDRVLYDPETVGRMIYPESK